MIHAPAWYTPEGSCIASRIEDDEPVIFMRSQLSTDPIHWRRVAQTALEIAEHFEQTPVYAVAELCAVGEEG